MRAILPGKVFVAASDGLFHLPTRSKRPADLVQSQPSGTRLPELQLTEGQKVKPTTRGKHAFQPTHIPLLIRVGKNMENGGIQHRFRLDPALRQAKRIPFHKFRGSRQSGLDRLAPRPAQGLRNRVDPQNPVATPGQLNGIVPRPATQIQNRTLKFSGLCQPHHLRLWPVDLPIGDSCGVPLKKLFRRHRRVEISFCH